MENKEFISLVYPNIVWNMHNNNIGKLIEENLIEWKDKSGLWIFWNKEGYFLTQKGKNKLWDYIEEIKEVLYENKNLIDFFESDGSIKFSDVVLSELEFNIFKQLMIYSWAFFDDNDLINLINGVDRSYIDEILESYEPRDIILEMELDI